MCKKPVRWPLRIATIVCLALASAGHADAPHLPGDRAVRLDLYGDPLPAGANVRLGTLRLRSYTAVDWVGFSPDGKTLASADHQIRFWDADSGKELRRIKANLDRLTSLALSPDGLLIACGGWRVRVWETATGKERFQEFQPNDHAWSVAFTPDNQTLAVARGSGVMQFWDVTTGKELRRFAIPIAEYARILFTPDGRSLVVSHGRPRSNEGKELKPLGVSIWDVASGKQVLKLEETEDVFRALALSPDGKTLAVATKFGSLIGIWELATGRRLASYQPNVRTFHAMAFSPDGKTLACGGDGDLALLDVATGQVKHLLGPGAGWVAFSPDGKTLAGASQGCNHEFFVGVHRWDTTTGEEIGLYSRHDAGVDAAVYTPDGKYVASSSKDRTLRYWEVHTGKQMWQHRAVAAARNAWGERAAMPFSFFPDGRTLAVADADQVRYLQSATGKVERRAGQLDGMVLSLAVSPDGKMLATGTVDKTPAPIHSDVNVHYSSIQLRDADTFQELWRIQLKRGGGRDVKFSPDGRILAAVVNGIALYDASTGRLIRTIGQDRSPLVPIYTFAFSPDSKTILSASNERASIRCTEIASGKEVYAVDRHRSSIYALAFSSDGKVFAAAGGLQESPAGWYQIAFHEASTGRLLSKYTGHDAAIRALMFAPDGRAFLTASEDTTMLIWDVPAEAREVRPVAKEMQLVQIGTHEERINSVSFSPGGQHALSTSNASIRLWDTSTWKEIRRFDASKWGVGSAVFADDGRRVLSGDGDGKLRLWDVNSGMVIRQFAGHTDGVVSVALTADGRHALSASSYRVKLWDSATGKELREFPPQKPFLPYYQVLFCPDMKRFLTGGAAGVTVFDKRTGNVVRHMDDDERLSVHAMAVSPDSKFALTGSPFAMQWPLALWDLETGKQVRRFEAPDGAADLGVVFSPDGRRALSASQSSGARLWDVKTGKQLGCFEEHKGWVTAVAFSPDGRLALSGGQDGALWLWPLPK